MKEKDPLKKFYKSKDEYKQKYWPKMCNQTEFKIKRPNE